MPHDMQRAATSFFPAERPRELSEAAHSCSNDEQFDVLRASLQPTGGLARGEDLALVLEDRSPGSGARVPELLASDRIFGFQRDRTFWVPMFQFEVDGVEVKRSALKARAELHGLDGWEVATWFATVNWWLCGRRPIELLDASLHEVLEAARIDRFIRSG
jgi:hypothetical protein